MPAMNGRPGGIKHGSTRNLTSPSSDSIELDTLQGSRAPHLDSPPTTQYGPHEYVDHNENDNTSLLGGEGVPRKVGWMKGFGQTDWCGQASSIIMESAPTLLLTTVGLLFTGELLDRVSRWKAMMAIDELIMIVPVILNLKGNLEMNLSARLGTAANMGQLDDSDARRKVISGSLALLQVQAAVVASVAACVSMILGLLVPDPPPSSSLPPDGVTSSSTGLLGVRAARPLPIRPGQRQSGLVEFVMVASSAMLSACLSSIVLGSFMCALIVVCRRYGRDPDNIAPPVASCLGDLVTLCLLGVVSSALINFLNTPLPLVVAICVVLSATYCAFIVRRNDDVKELIWQGWLPLFGAMVISSATGIVLDTFASRYEGFPMLAIVISGLPGSVGSILVSRLSTALHTAKRSPHGPNHEPRTMLVMLTLLLVTVPVEAIFLAILHVFGWLKLPIIFAVFSVLFFCCAVLVSLVVASTLTNFLWSKGLDPDVYALPIHSAMMDLVGQLLLVLCFYLVSLMGVNL